MTLRSPFAEGLRAQERGRFDEAIAFFTEAALDPRHAASALSKRGVCKVRIADLAGARADFEAALVRDPRCAPALTNLGNMAQEEGRFDSALERYQAAIAADANYAPAHHNLGVLYRKLGRVEESVRELRAAGMLEYRPRAIIERLRSAFRRD
ncbi:MAG TPA: tetratricopeptide repeat protein [Candidatus Eremiobacteraceae bacterium]|nr:tetratricopeptide repeat protein [Candidatus Eremiobacteraceae bacterium]